jgi:hypothetical protein
MKVTVANSKHVVCPGFCRAIPFSIGGEPFTTDFFALPLTGYIFPRHGVVGLPWADPLRLRRG